MYDPDENPFVRQAVTVSETLHRDAEIQTRNYIPIIEQDPDDDFPNLVADFSDTNLIEEYKIDNFTLKELVELVPKFLEEIKVKLPKKYLQRANAYIRALSGWVEDEIEVVI